MVEEIEELKIEEECESKEKEEDEDDEFEASVARLQELVASAKRIIIAAGAGVSVAAGIPDFRTPQVGLYDRLRSEGLARPEDIFDLEDFEEDPARFYRLAPSLFPDLASVEPTPWHQWTASLVKSGRVTRYYTQNVDGLEARSGIPPHRLVEAHGTLATASCIACRTRSPVDAVRQTTVVRCDLCDGLVKPDVVFFGEDLPRRFFTLQQTDVPAADLLIVAGTSLAVYPFAGLVHVSEDTPRVYLNMVPRSDIFHRSTDLQIAGDVQRVAEVLLRATVDTVEPVQKGSGGRGKKDTRGGKKKQKGKKKR